MSLICVTVVKELPPEDSTVLLAEKALVGCNDISMINEIIWRALGRASLPSKKEPLGITGEDGKRPDGVTLIPWSCGRCLTWDVTMSDTYATSHLTVTSTEAGEAANRAAANKRTKYSTISPFMVAASGIV